MNRRQFISALGGAASLVPGFSGGRPARGATPSAPRRFITMYWANGVITDRFWPSGANGVSVLPQTLPPILRPLQNYKGKNFTDHINVLGGVRVVTAPDLVHGSNGGGHASVFSTLTGQLDTGSRHNGDTWWRVGAVPSIDQHIATALAARNPGIREKRGLTLGAVCGSRLYHLSFRGSNDPVQPLQDPYVTFGRVFADVPAPAAVGGATPGPAATVDYLRATRKSILDHVHKDMDHYGRTRLGSEQRHALKAHQDQIRAVEAKLLPSGVSTGSQATLTSPALCRPVALDTDRIGNSGMPVVMTADGKSVDVRHAQNFPVVLKAQIDLAVMAMACDLTRVATFMCGNGVDDHLGMPWLGDGSATLHSLAHASGGADPGNARGRDRFTRANQWQVEQLAYLMHRLSEVPEGDGTMLDNTLIFVTSSQSDGGNHVMDGVPIVQAGRCGGAIKTGRYIKWGDWNLELVREVNAPTLAWRPRGQFVSNAALLRTFVRAMDVDPGTNYGTQELPYLLAG